ncbi:MAG: PIN domain-containing protein, partial [Thermomicrobia bacterium]|nr:PIN domain-containing protein [Thermomicrobia bacterium]
FDALLGTFYRVFELPLRKQIWQQSIDLMSLHGLESYDAAHVATALRAGLNDLATVDGKFARVSGLNVHIVR